MRKKLVHREGRSFKTLFLYIGLVLFVILISLSIKVFFVWQKNVFDGHNHFTLAIAKEGRVEELLSFNPSTPSLTLVTLDKNMALPELGSTVAVIPDAVIQGGDTLPVGENVPKTMLSALWQFPALQTKMTVFDVARLFFLSKNVSEENKIVKNLKLPQQESTIDKIIASFFNDDKISSENIPIRIINASDTPGVGKRLERVLNNLGCNIIGVTTANTKESKSKIEYKEKGTYTVIKLMKLLQFPAMQMNTENNADIVITIGEDSKNLKSF